MRRRSSCMMAIGLQGKAVGGAKPGLFEGVDAKPGCKAAELKCSYLMKVEGKVGRQGRICCDPDAVAGKKG